jgi:hypothetical protein
MLAHPRTDTQFRIAIRRCSVDMIDTVFEQDVDNRTSLVLAYSTKRRGTKNYASTLMTGVAERLRGYDISPYWYTILCDSQIADRPT